MDNLVLDVGFIFFGLKWLLTFVLCRFRVWREKSELPVSREEQRSDEQDGATFGQDSERFLSLWDFPGKIEANSYFAASGR